MNEHMLTNYGIIRSFHDNGKSVIDTLIPLVEYGIAEIAQVKKAHYDKMSLKNLILEKTGVKIQDITLTNLLKKLQKRGALLLFDKNQYFQILEEKKLEVEKYLSSMKSSERKLHKFIDAYRQYSGDIREAETIKQFNDLIEIADYYQGEDLMNKKDSLSINLLDGETKKQIVKCYLLNVINDINISEEYVNIYAYYGTYNSAVAVGITDTYNVYDKVIIAEYRVGDVTLYNYAESDIRIWVE